MMLCAADESRWHLASATSKVTGVAKSAADEGDQKNDLGHARSMLSILSMLSCLAVRTQQKIRNNSRDSLLSLISKSPPPPRPNFFVSVPFAVTRLPRETPPQSHGSARGTADARCVRFSRRVGAAPPKGLVAAHASVGVGADGGAHRAQPQTPLEREGVLGEEGGRGVLWQGWGVGRVMCFMIMRFYQ